MLPARPNRVGYVVKRYPRFSETFIVNEILAHEAAGIEVEIFSLRPPIDGHFQDRLARVRAPVHYMPSEHVRAADFWNAVEQAAQSVPGSWNRLPVYEGQSGQDVFQALLLAHAVKTKGIVHLHAHFASVATTVVRLAARLADVPYSFTAHAKDIFHEDVDPHDLRQKLADAAAAITVSHYNREYLLEQFEAPAHRVHCIYNGLPLDEFPYRPPNGRPPRIVGVGRLVEKKGFCHLIDACAALAATGRRFDCQIIGAGELEGSLRAQIDRLGLAANVCLTGPRPQAEVIALLHEASVLAAPCVVGADGNRDGMPTVLLEAMALGVPCVATDVTGIPEVVRHDRTGLIVRQHDSAELASVIDRLLGDEPLRIRLAEEARRLIEEEFDCHANAARIRVAIGIGSDRAPSGAAALQEVS